MNGETMNGIQKQEVDTQGAERARPRVAYRPRVDIRETEDAVWLVADVPGTDEQAVDLRVEKNLLTIRAEVHPPEFSGLRSIHSEYGIGDYERQFSLSEEIDREGIEATVKQGVLRVKLPKAKQTLARRIEVKAG